MIVVVLGVFAVELQVVSLVVACFCVGGEQEDRLVVVVVVVGVVVLVAVVTVVEGLVFAAAVGVVGLLACELDLDNCADVDASWSFLILSVFCLLLEEL